MVSEINDLQPGTAPTAAINSAVAELAGRLKTLADTLAARQQPTRVRYGRGRMGSTFKRYSPEGFVLDPVNLQMLLPDGRVWTYSRSDSARFPTGRYYDALTDYLQFAGSRTFHRGREFVFLGAVLGKYTFGFEGRAEGPGQTSSAGLCAIYGQGGSVRYVTADEAFGALAEAAATAATPDH